MTTTIQSSASTTPQSSAAQPSFETVVCSYASLARNYAIITLVTTILTPVTGIAMGTYCATDVAVKVAADMCGWNQNEVVARIAKAALSTILAAGVGFAVLSAFGVSIAPVVGAVCVVILAIKVLAESLPSRTA